MESDEDGQFLKILKRKKKKKRGKKKGKRKKEKKKYLSESRSCSDGYSVSCFSK